MAVVCGTGSSVTFSAASVGSILNITGPGLSRAAIDTSNMGTTGGYKTYIPGDLTDPGQVTCDILFQDNASVPTLGSTATLVIQWGSSTGQDWNASAFMTGYEPTAPFEDKMTARVTYQLSGSITTTA